MIHSNEVKGVWLYHCYLPRCWSKKRRICISKFVKPSQQHLRWKKFHSNKLRRWWERNWRPDLKLFCIEEREREREKERKKEIWNVFCCSRCTLKLSQADILGTRGGAGSPHTPSHPTSCWWTSTSDLPQRLLEGALLLHHWAEGG